MGKYDLDLEIVELLIDCKRKSRLRSEDYAIDASLLKSASDKWQVIMDTYIDKYGSISVDTMQSFCELDIVSLLIIYQFLSRKSS